jgi:hypothetical protein
VHGTITVARRPNPNVLFSTNPIYFEADEVDRLSDQTYLFKKTWLTICLPNRPFWKFYAAHATLKVNQKVVLVRANFRLLKVPLIYLPYASIPASQRVRQSGFMMPEFSENSTNGFVFGDSYYWAATDWMDAEGGVQFLSKRGWSQSLDLRAVPWNNVNLGLHYFGVEDRGLPGDNGALFSEGTRSLKSISSLRNRKLALCFGARPICGSAPQTAPSGVAGRSILASIVLAVQCAVRTPLSTRASLSSALSSHLIFWFRCVGALGLELRALRGLGEPITGNSSPTARL